MKMEKDSLVTLTPAQEHPRMATGSDFKAKGKMPTTAKGKDELVDLNRAQEMPATIEGDMWKGGSGSNTDSRAGVASHFPPKKAPKMGTDVSSPISVDFVTGEMHCKGGKQSPMKEVPKA